MSDKLLLLFLEANLIRLIMHIITFIFLIFTFDCILDHFSTIYGYTQKRLCWSCRLRGGGGGGEG